MKINLNTILLVLGGLGVFAPDLLGLAAWLAAMNVGFLVPVVKVIGWLATACAAAPLVVPRLRAFLAFLGLATPPGATAPWIPGKPGDPNAVATESAVVVPKGVPTPVTQSIRPPVPKDPTA